MGMEDYKIITKSAVKEIVEISTEIEHTDGESAKLILQFSNRDYFTIEKSKDLQEVVRALHVRVDELFISLLSANTENDVNDSENADGNRYDNSNNT